MKRRFLSALLFSVLFMSSVVCFKLTPTKAITEFTVEVTPNTTNTVADYRFQFSLEKIVSIHDFIQFNFPDGTTFTPPLPEAQELRKERLLEIRNAISGCYTNRAGEDPCKAPVFVSIEKDGSISIRFSSYMELDPSKEGYKDICLLITKKAGITTPKIPKSYTYRIATKSEPELRSSQPVDLSAGPKLIVNLNPPVSRSVARYRFTYVAEKIMRVHDWIHFSFPPGTTLTPPLPVDEKERNLRLKQIYDSIHYEVDFCLPHQGPLILDFQEDGSMFLKFSFPLSVIPNASSYRETVIVITEEAGITTPPDPGKYTYGIRTEEEPVITTSLPVEIIDSCISQPTIAVSYPNTLEPTDIRIDFTLGPAGGLHAVEDCFYIDFPKAFVQTFQSFIQDKQDYSCFVSINDHPIMVEPLWKESTLILPSPVTLSSKQAVRIYFKRRFGLMEPFMPGEYVIQVSTSKEKTKVLSKPFSVLSSDYSARLTITPAITNHIARIVMVYYNNYDIVEEGDIVSVTFPEGFILPESGDNEVGVTIQGIPPKELEFNQQTLLITSPIEIKPETAVRIVIEPFISIQTPTKADNYAFTILHQKSDMHFITNPVMIEKPKLEIEEVLVFNPHAEEKSDYQIKVRFPPDKIPEIGDWLTLKFTFSKEEILFYVTKRPEETVTFVIKNIQNPKPGEYGLLMSSHDENASYIPLFTIVPSLPFVAIHLIGGKTGNNGWYIQPPLLSFDYDDRNSIVTYGFDNMNFHRRFYSSPLPSPGGFYLIQLHYFAENAYGKSELGLFEFKLDTIKPEFIVTNPCQKNTSSNLKTIPISGRVEPIKLIYDCSDDGSKLIFDTDLEIVMENETNTIQVNPESGSFSADILLDEGNHLVRMVLKDIAGNQSIQDFWVLVDTIPPEISIISPRNHSVTFEKKILIEGMTEPNIRLLVHDMYMKSDEKGKFTYEVSLEKIGPYTINITAEDGLGNASTISVIVWLGYSLQLVIGSKQAKVNEKEVTLPTPPIIEQGRTLVPFRFIGEAIEIPVSYRTDPLTKKVTHVFYHSPDIKIELLIGNSMALVNGKPIQMEVPPQIIEGSTMIPLRFVTENLGFHLEWNPADQTIHLQYPGKFADTGQ